MSEESTTQLTRAELIERLLEEKRYDLEEEVNVYESTLESFTDDELQKEAADVLDETVLMQKDSSSPGEF